MLTEKQLLEMPESDYMNEAQLAFFKHRLESERQEAMATVAEAKKAFEERVSIADISDWASSEEERQKTLRTIERNQGRLNKIRKALELIDQGDYGWCEDTGAPIGIRRLLVRPTATLCIEAKQVREAKERHIYEQRGAA